MFHKFIICLILLFPMVFVQGLAELIQPGPPDSCFKTKFIHRIDRYHKDVPSPEGSDFPDCQTWKELSCCTLALTEKISHSRTLALYNFTKDLCHPISPRCAEYLGYEECFYWCEPMLQYFQPVAEVNIRDVPICMDYCDAWFDACKDDYTCFDDWLENFIIGTILTNCSAPYTCRTFREVFGDGEGLCNNIWGTAYTYSTDADNCTVMHFDNSMPNPNFKLTFPRSGSLSKLMLNSLLMRTAVLMTFLLIAVYIF